jgi:acyl-homoserine lactone acylase PvdQ
LLRVKERKIMGILIKVLRWLLTISVALALVGNANLLWASGSRPHDGDTVEVVGARKRIEILRDGDDVPHIRAKSEWDALFGLGYVHAQDRLWQMEFQRRLGNGRLAEILGDAGLPTDRLFRTVGLQRTAAAASQFEWTGYVPFEELPQTFNPPQGYIASSNNTSYDDLLERWQRVGYMPMRYDRKTVEGAAHERLELVP